jgi:hypothetical protein
MSLNYHLDLLNKINELSVQIESHVINIEDQIDDFDDNINNADQEKNKDYVSNILIDKTKPITEGEILINYFQNKNVEIKNEIINIIKFAEDNLYFKLSNNISTYSPDTIYTLQDLSNILFNLSNSSESNGISNFLGKTIKVNVNGNIEDRYISTISGNSTINSNNLSLGYSSSNFEENDVIEKNLILTNIDYDTNQVIEKEVTLLISKGDNDDIKFDIRFLGEFGNTIIKKIDITSPNSISFNSLINTKE